MKEMLFKYARYNFWANEKLVKTITSKAPQLLDKEIHSSFDCIRKTIMHVADAEYIWHCRMSGVSFDKIPGKSGVGIEALAEADQKLIDFIIRQDENYFAASTAYKSIKGDPFTNNNFAIFWHVFNHSTFHRGQIVSMMRNGGYKDPIDSTDFISFERL